MSPTPQAEESLLIVDDDAFVRQLLSDLAKEAGFVPHAVASIDEAEERVATVTFAGALLDITLKGEDGDQLCRWLRVQEKTWNLPILMVTGLEQPDVLRRCLVAGADDFVLKPVHRHEVLTKLKAIRHGGEPGFQRKLEKKRVLLATQHPFYLNNVARVLTASGCAVEVATEREGLSRSLNGRTPPEVAVLDLDLWGPEDLEWVRRLEVPTASPMNTLLISTCAVQNARPVKWKGAPEKVWNNLGPMDTDEERDELLRHIGRVVTLGGSKGNTRRKARVPFYSAVRFHWADEPEWLHGIGFDLSESGIFVRTLAPLRPARRSMEMTFKIEGESSTVKGMVVWANAFGARHLVTLPFGMGISFTEIPEDTADLIRRYVSTRMRPHSH